MKRVLLHICCGVCLSHPLDELRANGYFVVGFFSNSNISPAKEYLLREKGAREVAKLKKMPLILDDFNYAGWQQYCRGLEQAPEGGKRCVKCFDYRLIRAFAYARQAGYDFFTTTMTVSPYKRSKDIFQVGHQINSNKFLQFDFKKNDGFKKTMSFAKENNIYIQKYCGCEYAKNTKL